MTDRPTYYSPQPNDRGMDDLQYAAYCGDADGVQELIDRGADVHSTEDRGYTALQWAVDMACAGGQRIDTIELLIKAGSNVNHRENDGTSILQTAIRSTACDEILGLLRAAGASGTDRELTCSSTSFVFRSDVINNVRCMSSVEVQRDWQQRLSIANVPAFLLEIWEELHVPKSPIYVESLSEPERVRLAEFHLRCQSCARTLAEAGEDLSASAEWKALMGEAQRVVDDLGWSNDGSSEAGKQNCE